MQKTKITRRFSANQEIDIKYQDIKFEIRFDMDREPKSKQSRATAFDTHSQAFI